MIKTGGVGWLAHRTDEAGSSLFIYSLIDFFILSCIFIVLFYPASLSSTFFDFVVDPCDDVFCLNGGTCILTPESYLNASKPCICQKRFFGRLCDAYVAGKNVATTFQFLIQHCRKHCCKNLYIFQSWFLRAFVSKSDRRAAWPVIKCNLVTDCTSSQSACNFFKSQS